MKTICSQPETNEKLLLLFEKGVDEKQRQEIVLHLQECSVCTEEFTKLQEIHTALKIHTGSLGEQQAAGDCISPDLLVNFSEDKQSGSQHRLSQAESAAITRHLGACPACQEQYDSLILLNQALQTQPLKEQKILGERQFMEMVSREYPPGKIVIREVALQAMAALKSTMDGIKEWMSDLLLPQPQPVYVRKAKRKFQENITVLKETSLGIAVTIEIEAIDNDNVELLVLLSATRKKQILADLRCSLFQEGDEIASLFVEQGKAVFKNVPHGLYDIVLSRQGKEIKRIQCKTQ